MADLLAVERTFLPLLRKWMQSYDYFTTVQVFDKKYFIKPEVLFALEENQIIQTHSDMQQDLLIRPDGNIVHEVFFKSRGRSPSGALRSAASKPSKGLSSPQ